MEASAWKGGKSTTSTYGIRVGVQNRDTYFDPTWTTIEIEVDGVFHTFQITPGFWRRCPEFRDSGSPVIRGWLNRHYTLTWPRGEPPRVELIPLGDGRFRLGS